MEMTCGLDRMQLYFQEFYNLDSPVAEDVIFEQKKINEADAIAFIYPDFWTSSPAMFEGWFQRVWTYGFAYGDQSSMKCLEKVIFLITMGGSLKDKVRRDQLEAMKTVMVGDLIRNRAKTCEIYAFDEMTRGYGNDANRDENASKYISKVFEIARDLSKPSKEYPHI